MIPSVFSPSVFGPSLARALDGLLAVQAEDTRSYASSPFEHNALNGSVCTEVCGDGSLRLQPRGDDFYAADQLSRHYYSAAGTSVQVALHTLPGLSDALGGLSLYDIRKMLKAQWEKRNCVADL